MEYDYDLAGNPVAVYAGRETAAKKAAAQRLTYDARCNITGVGDGNHNWTEFVLDAWGRITEIHTPEGGVERYTYDYAGNITGTEDANGGIVTYRYNSLGQVYEITDQEGNTESFYCDKEGRRETYLSSYELLIQHEQYKIFIDLLEYIDYLREQEEKIFFVSNESFNIRLYRKNFGSSMGVQQLLRGVENSLNYSGIMNMPIVLDKFRRIRRRIDESSCRLQNINE